MSTFPFPQAAASPYVAVNAGSTGANSLSVSIRAVHSQDLVSLAEVLASSFHRRDGLIGLLYPLLRMGIYEDLKSRLHSRTAQQICLVAVRQGELSGGIRAAALHQLTRYVPGMESQPLVGTVELAVRLASVWQPQRAGYLYLSNLAVHVDFRHRGVAQQLLAACEKVALEWGFKNLYLHVLENNYSARRLYRRAGYRLQSVESGLGNLVLGQPKQLFLRKVLVSEPH
jgi:ribosomal protein S18 acetylase RimI-like enzyme